MSEHRIESFDYLKVTVDENRCSQYIDDYQKFGWKLDENMQMERNMGKATIHMKRSRHIMNKVELTRLQQHYESCMEEIATLEASKKKVPTVAALSCGIVGCAFMAGSVFAVTSTPPIYWLMVLLAIPGFALWGSAYFVYREETKRRIEKIDPLIEAKQDEAEAVCEKAYRLR